MKKISPTKEESDPDFIKFSQAVPVTSDPITMVLRCHLLAEVYLDRLIDTKMSKGYVITDNKFQFYEKLVIVEALDILTKDVLDSLKKLNSVRNSCSHVLEYNISERDIDKIGHPLGKDYQIDKKELQPNINIKKLLHITLLTLMARTTGQIRRAI